MLVTIFTLLAILYLPGAIIFRLPLANRAKRGALPAEERLFWAVIISMIVTTTATFGLAALAAYTLGRVVALNTLLAVIAALAARGNLKLDRGEHAAGVDMPTWRRWSTAAIPAVLVTLATWMYFAVPPAEWVLGGRDPGVYMNEGIQIAQRRSLMTADPLVAAVPPEARDLFFPAHDSDSYYSMRFMGFHLRDPDAGTVSGQFPQGFPAWVAIAYGIDGLSGARRVISWWAILGVLATYFAAQRLIGPVAAAAAAGLLTIHVVHTWYARYPNSEMMTQALLFSALLAHAYAHEEEDGFFGPVSASLLGLALFARFPEVVVVGAAVGATLLAHVNGHKASKSFLLTLILWLAAAGAYYTTQLAPYFARPLTYIGQMDFYLHVLPLRAAAVAIAVFLLATYNRRVARATRTWLPVALAGAVAVAAAYAYYLREPGGLLAPHDAHALRTFVNLYLTLPAFALAILGYALVCWRSFWRAPALMLALTTASVFFFYKLRIFPEHFWLARRFVPMILPGALILAAGAAFAPLWLFNREQTKTPRSAMLTTAWVVIGAIAVVMIGWNYWAASQPIRRHVEYAGIIPRMEQFAGTFGTDDLVLVEAREASDVHVLALPLAYIYARDVLVLARSRPDKAAFAQFLTWARQRYKNVYFVAGGGTDLLSPGIGSEVVASSRFQIPEYEQTPYPVLPRVTLQKPFDFTTYRIVESRSTSAPSSLDIGGADDLQVIDFFPKERLGGGAVNFRWTQDRSHLRLAVGPHGRDLVLRLSSGRAPGIAPAKITVSLGSHELGAAEPTPEFKDYVFHLPASAVADLAVQDGLAEFELRSTTWSPHDLLSGRDVRNLGVMVDRAEIR